MTNIQSDVSEDEKFLTAVIETCMLLHGSEHIGDITLEDIVEDLESLALSEYPERAEFRELLRALVGRL